MRRMMNHARNTLGGFVSSLGLTRAAGEHSALATSAQSEAGTLARGTAGLLFLSRPWVGFVFILLLLRFPASASAGAAALAGAFGTAWLLGLSRSAFLPPTAVFNPLLAGLAVVFAVPSFPLALGLSVAAGALALLLHMWLAQILSERGLPVLSLPFMISAWAVQLVMPRTADNALTTVTARLEPLTVESLARGFCEALGWVFFLPDALSGVFLAIALLISSRILFLLAVSGYLVGIATLAVLDTGMGFPSYPFAFNFALIAMALGGALLKPGPRSLGLALAATALAALLGEGLRNLLQAWNLPPYALAYCLTSLLILFALRTTQSNLLPLFAGESPERMIERYATLAARPGELRAIALPVCGTWRVSQGRDGAWTHQGPWRYACDFDCVDASGKAFSGEGMQLSDYYAFGKPVIAPVRGSVVSVVNHLPDEPPGTVNHANNWGNHVVLFDERGFYVLLGHLQQHSITVSEGQAVSPGMLVARVGNSGYSPTPHLHVQAQLSADAGAASIPFEFGGVVAQGEYQATWIPQQNAHVIAAPPDDAVRWATSFKLDDELRFAVRDAGGAARQLNLKANMGLDGCFYLDSGMGQLWFTADSFKFKVLSVTGDDADLEAFALALPTLPLVRGANVSWTDAVPVRSALPLIDRNPVRLWAHRAALELLAWMQPRFAVAQTRAQWSTQDTVTGSIAVSQAQSIPFRLQFDERGIGAVQVGERSFARLANPSHAATNISH